LQDIQGNIHTALRKRITSTFINSPPPGQYPFSFQTAWDDQAGAISAAVVWHENGMQQNVNAAYKRDLNQTFAFLDVIYDNGSVASFVRPLTESEVRREWNCSTKP
jgi:hypothetical protein